MQDYEKEDVDVKKEEELIEEMDDIRNEEKI